MPRDLSSLVNQTTLSGMSGLTPDKVTAADREASPMDDDTLHSSAEEATSGNARRNELHPYVQTLSIADLESCVQLEEAAFQPQERASKEKVSLLFYCSFLPPPAAVLSL